MNQPEKIPLHGHHYGPNLYPVPVVLVTCEDRGAANIIPICWTGVLCSSPPIVYISVRPNRYSYALIAGSGRFVINIPPGDMLETIDLAGRCSGRNTDKFRKFNLSKMYLIDGYPPVIAECSHHLFCDVIQVIELGTHHVFIGQVKHERIDDQCTNQDDILFAKINPVVYCPENYMLITDSVGRFMKTGTNEIPDQPG